MTDSEKNAISAGMLVAAKMTEMFLDFWCRMEHATLTGKHKQMFNMMQHHAKSLRYYYEQLTDRTVTVLYDEDKDSKRIDQLLEDAGDLSRIYLTVLNCSQNGYDPQAIIDAMNRLIDHEPEPKRIVSNEIIDKFKVRI